MKTQSLARFVMAVGLGLLSGVAWAQSAVTTPGITGSTGTTDWPLSNLNLSNNRYAPLDEINVSNVAKLALAWSFDAQEPIGKLTPLVVDGIMYGRAGSKVFSVNAVTGAPVWTGVEPALKGSSLFGRGLAYGDGRIYVSGGAVVFAVDAKTGKAVESFGDKGVLPIVSKALEFKYPQKYPAGTDPLSLGYLLTTPPTYYAGTLYVPVANGDNHIDGGLIIAVDGTTGSVKWVFNTIPQGPKDEGWEIGGGTWRGGARTGGGVWTTPAIDPELGFLYINAGNPSPAYDGAARKGINLFTNSTIALHLTTGKLAWYFQAIHHDIWDWDLTNGLVLFEGSVAGRLLRGIAAAGKNCHYYVWDRQTGTPVNPIVETAVPTKTDRPGEEVWPTQPKPYTARGTPQQPLCATLPIVTDSELAKRVRPLYEPLLTNEFVIISPGAEGGANWGASSFSPKTGLLYITALNSAQSSKVKSIGDTAVRGPGYHAFSDSRGTLGPTGMNPTVTLSANDPLTGVQAWRADFPAFQTQRGGNLVTAGHLVFQGTSFGTFYALDARSGRELWKVMVDAAGVNANPITYQVGGKQYVSVAGSNSIFTFSLP